MGYKATIEYPPIPIPSPTPMPIPTNNPNNPTDETPKASKKSKKGPEKPAKTAGKTEMALIDVVLRDSLKMDVDTVSSVCSVCGV